MNFKSLLACAALLIGIGTATAAVESDIVGYATVTLKKGYNMLAVNFESLTSEDGISIQDLGFTLEAGFQGGTGPATGDQIQVYDAQRGEYTTYFLYNNERRPTDTKNGKWCSTTGVATATFKSGDSFWFLKRGENDATISIAGAVSIQETQAISIVKGYTMIGNAFPINFNPNDLGVDYWMAAIASGAQGGTGPATGDQIQVYDAQRGEYTTYFLYNNTRRPTDAKNGKWYNTATSAEIAPKAEILSMGHGAWYLHRNSGFTLTLSTPLK